MSLTERLAEVIAQPFDDEPRLAYARECEADDPERAEFIRLQVDRAKHERGGSASPVSPSPAPSGDMELFEAVSRKESEQRERELLVRHAAHWSAPLGPLGDEGHYDRGFLCEVTIPGAEFLARGGALRTMAPILRFNMTGCQPIAEALFTSADLAGVPALGLTHNDLSTIDLVHLSSSPHLERLWWLDLGGNRIDFAGVKLLASSRFLPALSYVGLAGNPSDPMETVGVEGYAILDSSLPEDGERLEALYGPISWIHYPGDSIQDWPPSPLEPRP